MTWIEPTRRLAFAPPFTYEGRYGASVVSLVLGGYLFLNANLGQLALGLSGFGSFPPEQVAIFALQFARMFGARVIGTSSSTAKAERLKQMGAEAVIDYKTKPDWDQETLRLTGGRGADITVEVGGAGTLPRSFMATRLGGSIAVIGLLSGMATLDPMPILRRRR